MASAMALIVDTNTANSNSKLNSRTTVASRTAISKLYQLFLLRLDGVPDHVSDKEHSKAEQRDGEFGVVLFDDVLLPVR